MEKTCLKCGKKFNKGEHCSKKEWETTKFCSHKCANSFNMVGTKRCIGREPWNKGKICLQLRGENNHNWKSGPTNENLRIRKSLEYALWRSAIFTRDSFTCQKCGEKGGRLIAHHINNFSDFPDKRLAIDNGITLCRKCHIEFHKRYWLHNNTREQLEEFLLKQEA